MSDFKSLNLAGPIMWALDELGYTTPTPIQLKAIPDVIKGRDLMGIAQTGTGKTAAFSLPLLHHLCVNDHEPPRKGARALILAPTRELASQIAVSIEDYGRKMDFLSVTTVFGGASIQRQIKRLSGGNDIIVATPGRLIDLLDRKAVSLRDIEMLILDEADQMMDMGFIHALKQIVPLLPEKRQTLFFSATMVPKIKKLAGQFLNDPVTISVTPANSTAERVEQRVTFVTAAQKPALLGLSLLDPEVDRALVFTRTKHGADRACKRLAKIGLSSMAIHGNKSQGQRQFALSQFREGVIKILVATDVAARGIDIEGITHVFNYEIPNVPEQYVHRIGRTARANRSGIAHAFVAKDERGYLKDIQRLLKTTIPVVELPEDFDSQSRALALREPVPMVEKPKTETRKGRGKSSKKKKARFSKDKAKKAQGEFGDSSDAPRRKKKPHRGQGKSEAPAARNEESAKPKRFAKGDEGYRSRKPKFDHKGKRGETDRSEKKSWDKKSGETKSWDKKPNNRKSGPRRDENERPSRGPKRGEGKPRKERPAKGAETKSYGKNKDSRAARKAANQARHAEQHSRRKPKAGSDAKPAKKSGGKPFGKKPIFNDGGKPAAKKPHQRYGKRRGPNKPSSKPSGKFSGRSSGKPSS